MTRLLVAVAAALAVPAATSSAAVATTKPCKPPTRGFHACLNARYISEPDGAISDLRLTATLVHRAGTCPRRVEPRRVTIRDDDGRRLARARRPGSCRRGIERWRAVFSAGETAGWGVEPGTTLVSRWQGTTGTTSVTLRARSG